MLVATLGPGITNTSTAVAQALLDRSAVVVITGEIATSLKAVYTHQIIDQESMMRPLVKWTTNIAREGAFAQVRKGLAIAQSAMPGPVHFNLPTDVAAADQAEGARFSPQSIGSAPDTGQLERAIAWLRESKKPLAFVGVGVQLDHGEEALRQFLERWRVPFVATYKAKGVVPEDHELCVGANGAFAGRRQDTHELDTRCGSHPRDRVRPGRAPQRMMAPWGPDKRSINTPRANTHHVYRTALAALRQHRGRAYSAGDSGPATVSARWSAPELDGYRKSVRTALAQ